MRVKPVGLVTAEKFFNQQAKTAFRDHLRALAQRVEVDAKEVGVMGSKSVLLRTLVAAFKRKNGGFWSAQFRTQVARPKRFELLTPRFVVLFYSIP